MPLSVQEVYREDVLPNCSCGNEKAIFFCVYEPPCHGQYYYGANCDDYYHDHVNKKRNKLNEHNEHNEQYENQWLILIADIKF
jgi:hypothetical protein